MSGKHRRRRGTPQAEAELDSDLEWVVLLVAVVAVGTYFVLGPVFEGGFQVVKDRIGSGRLSLVVSTVSLIALVLAVVNTIRVWRGGPAKALKIQITETAWRFLLGVTAVAIGMFIGRTIFT